MNPRLPYHCTIPALSFTRRRFLLLGALPFLASLAACAGKPSPYTVLDPYLKAWEESRYADMYDLLSAQSQAATPKDRFVQRYTAIAEGSTILSVKTIFTIDEKLAKAEQVASLPFTVTMQTSRLGQIRQDNLLPVVYEGELWRVNWSPSLIFKELAGDNRVLFEPEDPLRGTIYDRKDRPLATKGKVISAGVVPGQIEDEPALLAALEKEIQVPAAQVKSAMKNAQPDWFVPLRDLSAAQAAAARPKLEKLPGVLFREKSARTYPFGASACHVTGYLRPISPDELKAKAARGYTEDDLVGAAGLEEWAEDTLAGEKGAKLSVVSPQGQPVAVIAQKPAHDGQDLHLSIDMDLQKLAEDSLGPQGGSVVILDTRDNSVLALAGYPRFDPNQFITGFTDAEWKQLNDDPLHPFQNRPVASSYPSGSVFKVVTMAAGLEKGGFTPQTPFDCNGRWDGLGNGVVLGDWLPQGHGHLDLFEGLVESCDIVFYEVGKRLNSLDPDILPTFANWFGYGKPTGLTGLPEASGLVPDPAWKKSVQKDDWYLGDTVNLAIGQGFFLSTPLQVANCYAALARGGSLMTPALVAQSARASTQFKTESRGALPVSPANLDTIRRAMRLVISDPKGTANYAFLGAKYTVAAKTGSAEAVGPDTHAWFAAYAPAEQPRISLVVMVEGKGHGGEVAAPVARKILDRYFH